ncbi:MAG TPA: aminodeoxychorismate synthase component I [Gemmatimonadaceae bacterium]|nr:aminodeoxychorismate synthase component I [Gemmatimonadaceae bacterium]
MTLPLVEELVPAPDPASACAALLGLPYLLFLDSATHAHARDAAARDRYSFLAADPAIVVRCKAGRAERLDYRDGSRTPVEGHSLAEIRRLVQPFHADPLPDLPPFQGGAAGYIAYDWGSVLERLPTPRYDDLSIPDVVLGLYDCVVAWDHDANRAWIVSTGLPDEGRSRGERARLRLTDIARRLAAVPGTASGGQHVPHRRAAIARAPSYPVRDVAAAAPVGLRSSFTHRGYLDAVTRVREYIVAGDIFQANVSQRLEAPLRESSWSLYQRLRAVNPAPFAAYLAFEELHVLSASPERFLRLDDTRRVEARPIKGTRPRGVHPVHDAALGRALADSAKDRAENLMIVDLLRNDLSRVCAPRSVRVPELFALEHYSTVHHLVSTVTGELEAGCDAVDLLTATFPGGSITGAPKVRAMEIIAELEPSRRGVYCGSIGYIAVTGVMDTSIVIRTYQALDDTVYFSVGGGIVADSDPEQEYRETLDKARALIDALAPAGQPAHR